MSIAVKFSSPQPRLSRLAAIYVIAAWSFSSMNVAAQAGSNGLWRAQSIYQIFTDRFFDGDPANNNLSGSYNASGSGSVHGGDFKGIEQKLNYIKSLGATALWISPIVLNSYGEYHGYAGRDFYQVDPHWGTLANLQSLVNAAHAKGLLVIQDVVVNHGGTLNNINGNTAFNYPGGYTLNYANASRKYAAPFNTNAANPSLTNLFHNYGAIQDNNSVTQTELGELSGLDDFRTESAYIRTNMAAVYDYWIQTAGFDGFRVDTVKHVEMGFWQDWSPRIHAFAATNGRPNFFMFGECFDGSDAKCASYAGTSGGGAFKLDSMLDYPLFFTSQNVFATAAYSTKSLEDHYTALASSYDPGVQNQLVTFLDNHDTTRFLNSANANGNTNRLMVALTFLLTSRGVPCVYQGTEQAFDGGVDPNNREDMFDGQFEQGPSLGDNFNLTHPLFQWIARLNNFRRLYPALQNGSHLTQWNDASGPGLFAYSRRLGTQEVFVVFNTSGTLQTLPSRGTIYPAGTKLVNLFDTNETGTVLIGSQTPAITVPGTSSKIFIAQSQLLPLDPVVVSNSPAHDAMNVPTPSRVVLRFSKPMNTNSVQTAFSTAPPVSGAFTWSAAADVMTFTPGGSGFPALTNVTVTVSNSAFDAVAGKTLFAPYELLFHTAAPPPVMQFSSPASNGMVIPMASNSVYLVQVCFTPTLTTNDASLFSLTVNGVLQPRASYIFRPPGAVAGCPGLRSLLYNWSGADIGTNILSVVFSNNAIVLADTRTVIVPPPLIISDLTNNYQTVVWSSTPGFSYTVLGTTNLTQPFIPISPLIPASGLSTSFLDASNSPLVPQKFYRIQVAP